MTAPRRSPLPPRAGRAVFATALTLAGCGTAARTAPEPVAGVMTREVFVPIAPPADGAAIHDFAVAPWTAEGGECMLVRTTPTGAEFETVYYPTRRDATVSIALTLDSAGHLIRSSENHGVLQFRIPPGDTTRAGRDSAVAAASRALHATTISLDYVTDDGLLLQRGGAQPMRSMRVSTTAVGDLPLLGRPAERARDAARHCRVGIYAADRDAGAAPETGPRSRMAPDDVAREFFGDVGTRQWSAAAALIDPYELARLRVSGLRALLGWAQAGAPTMAKQPPGVPYRGEFSWARDTTLLAAYDTIAMVTAAGPTTVGAMARLSPVQFAAATLDARFGRSSSAIAPEIFGVVTEGDSLAHVVYQMRYAAMPYAMPAAQRTLLRLRRVDGGWRVMPENFLGGGDLVSAAMNYRPSDMRN